MTTNSDIAWHRAKASTQLLC